MLRSDLPRVEYRSDSDLSLCPDAPERVQRRVEVLERTLGVKGPAKIRYVHTSHSEDAARLGNCPLGAVGCSRGTDAYAADYVNYHEIAHAVLWATAASPNPLLREGLAEAFGYLLDSTIFPASSWRDLVDIPVGDPHYDLTYSYGSRLVTRLFNDFGPEKLIALYERASSNLGPDEFAARFQGIYGFTVDEIWASIAVMPFGAVCVDLADNTDLSGTNNVLEPQCPGEVVPARHVWTLGADTPLAIETTYRQVLLGSCSPNLLPTDGEVLYNDAAGLTVLSLGQWSEGSYYATPSRVDGTESFRISKGTWLGENCDGITPYRIQVAPSRFSMGLPDRHWLALEWTGEQPLDYLAGLDTGMDNSTWYQCSTCNRTQCVPLVEWAPLTIAPGVTWFFAERGSDVRTKDTWLYGESVE